jgi:hypothetical protein
MNNNTTNTNTSNMDELTLDTMVLSLKQLEVELKIKDMVDESKNVVAYFPRYFHRPDWLVRLLQDNNVKSKRSRFVEDRNFYLLDTDKFHFWDRPEFDTENQPNPSH